MKPRYMGIVHHKIALAKRLAEKPRRIKVRHKRETTITITITISVK